MLQLLTFAIGMLFFQNVLLKVMSFFVELKVGNTFASVMRLNNLVRFIDKHDNNSIIMITITMMTMMLITIIIVIIMIIIILK